MAGLDRVCGGRPDEKAHAVRAVPPDDLLQLLPLVGGDPADLKPWCHHVF
jgi:hypothetical protein